MAVKPIPDGMHTITPGLRLKGADKAVEFFQAAFGAKVLQLYKAPSGAVVHCEMQVGDSRFRFVESPDGVVKNLTALLYVPDCDAVFNAAVANGATVMEPLADQFYGDRTGRVKDPFGNEWMIATHKEDVSPEELKARAAKATGSKPA